MTILLDKAGNFAARNRVSPFLMELKAGSEKPGFYD